MFYFLSAELILKGVIVFFFLFFLPYTHLQSVGEKMTRTTYSWKTKLRRDNPILFIFLFFLFYIFVFPTILQSVGGREGMDSLTVLFIFYFFFYYIFFLHPLCNLLEKERGQHLFYFCFLFMFLFSTSTCNLMERGLGQPCLFYFVFLILHTHTHTPCNFLGKKRTITFFFFLFFFLFFGGRNSILFYASLKSCRELKQDRTKPLHLTVN